MKILKTKNYDELSRVGANIISSQIILNSHSVLGLATGSSPEGLYKELIKKYKEGIIDFSNIKTFNLDEYKSLNSEHVQSYRYFMNTHLFNHINIDKNNTYIPNGLSINEIDECLNYEKKISELGGIDLQLIGLGLNGHIGFNEPSSSFTKSTHCVKLSEITLKANSRFFDKLDDVPKYAYTMGIGTIMSAKAILLIVSGKEKADILYKSLFGPITPNVPASILQFHKNLFVVADEDALHKINNK